MLNESPVSVESAENELILRGSKNAVYKADLIIAATGRVPNLRVFEGAHGSVEHSQRGAIVNEFLQNISNPKVYAVGDCAATTSMLALVSDEEGKTAACNILIDKQTDEILGAHIARHNSSEAINVLALAMKL